MKCVGIIGLVCYLVLGASAFIRENISGKVRCSTGDVSFACPKGFKPLPVESPQAFTLLYHKEYRLGLFVASPEAKFDENRFVSDVTKVILGKIFPKETRPFAWKPLNFSDSVSKFEMSRGMAQGFNGNLSVLIKYRHLKIKEKDILVGYVAEFGKGRQARESFETGLGGDSMPGCNASVEVIYSITGESADENSHPCELIAILP